MVDEGLEMSRYAYAGTDEYTPPTLAQIEAEISDAYDRLAELRFEWALELDGRKRAELAGAIDEVKRVIEGLEGEWLRVAEQEAK